MLRTSPRPTEQDVLDAVRQAVGAVLEIDPIGITRESTFVDLRADSLVLVEVAEILEERYAPGLTIPDAELEALGTIGDAVDFTLAQL